jgi:hypothetical protein
MRINWLYSNSSVLGVSQNLISKIFEKDPKPFAPDPIYHPYPYPHSADRPKTKKGIGMGMVDGD